MIEAVRVLQSEKVYSNCDSASCCCTDWVNRIISWSSLSSVCVCACMCDVCGERWVLSWEAGLWKVSFGWMGEETACISLGHPS